MDEVIVFSSRQINKFNFKKLIKYLSEEADFDMYLHIIKNGKQKVTLTQKIKDQSHSEGTLKS